MKLARRAGGQERRTEKLVHSMIREMGASADLPSQDVTA
jgi:hypothetical protein